MINEKRLVNNFLELVKIDSVSGDEKRLAEYLKNNLEKLGLETREDSYGNLIAKLQGRGKPFMLNTHMDTVEPGRNIKPVVKGDIISSDGSTVLGADPKAGIAIILEALQAIKEEKGSTPSLEVVFTREEETTLGGAQNLDYSLIKAKEGIVFDGDEEVGKIFVSSPTYYSLDVEIVGRSAHAGVEPEKGISAIEIAAKIINQLKLGRIDRETTYNIGIIHGGNVRNAVPDRVMFQGEIRSRNLKALEKILEQTERIFEKTQKDYPEAKIVLSLNKDFDGFKLSKNNPLIRRVSKVLRSMKIKPELKDSGGGSDANIFFTKDLEVVIVGTGVYEPHSTREYLVIPQMAEAANFCLNFLKEISTKR